MTDRHACSTFDETLIEAAVDGVLTPEIEAHLDACGACRRSLSAYQTTLGAIGGAFRHHQPHRPLSRLGRALYLITGALATAAALLLGSLGLLTEKAVAMNIAAEAGAVVRQLGPAHARIEAGTSTFEFGDTLGVVDTPSGPLRCSRCQFTVEVVCGEADTQALPAGLIGLVVQVTVAAGRVDSTRGSAFRMVLPGDTVTLHN